MPTIIWMMLLLMTPPTHPRASTIHVTATPVIILWDTSDCPVTSWSKSVIVQVTDYSTTPLYLACELMHVPSPNPSQYRCDPLYLPMIRLCQMWFDHGCEYEYHMTAL